MTPADCMLALTLNLVLGAGTGLPPACEYPGYYLYLGNDPEAREADWTEAVQGLAHDEGNWFITQVDRIWRAPAFMDLRFVSFNTIGITHRALDSYPDLSAFNHFGDLVHYEFAGIGFLLAPLTGDGNRRAIAAFLPSDLSYIDHIDIDSTNDLGWCAVSPAGQLFISDKRPSEFVVHDVDWGRLVSQETLAFTSTTTQPFFDENGGPLQLHHAQGGEFSPDGTLLYFCSGYCTEDTDKHAEGIHVFDTTTWRRIEHSTNGYGYFNFEFHPSEVPIFGGCDGEEPEGLTVWNLEATLSPHAGQLHVLMLNNDADTDDVYLKHYTGTIEVDAANTGPQDGTPDDPFRTVTAACGLAWDRASIRIHAGVYPEVLTLDRPLCLHAAAGVARIGG